MAEGARRVSGSTWAIATTGVVGPDGGTPEKPVGLGYVGIAGPDGVRAERLMLRGEVEGAELESLAAEHNIPVQKRRCVLYFYFAQTSTEEATALLEGVIDPESDVLTEVGRHSLALMKALEDEDGADSLAQLAAAGDYML